MQVAQCHTVHEKAEAGLFARAIESPVAVPLVDDVVMLGIEPTGQFGMASKRVDRPVIIPAPVDVSGAALIAPHVAELGVQHGLARLSPRCLEIPMRSGIGAVADLLHALLPPPARQVLVPGVEVRLRVPATAARRVVLDQPRRVE